MEFIIFILSIIFIIFVYIFTRLLKNLKELIQDISQDYFELKAQNTKLECYLKDIDDNNTMLNNKIINLEKDLKKVSDLHNAK